MKKQNTQNQEYTMEKLPPENSNTNYPALQTSNTNKKNANPTKTTKTETSTPDPKTPEITVVPETQIMSETQTSENTFISPLLITNGKYHLVQSTTEFNDLTTLDQTIKQTESNN